MKSRTDRGAFSEDFRMRALPAAREAPTLKANEAKVTKKKYEI